MKILLYSILIFFFILGCRKDKEINDDTLFNSGVAYNNYIIQNNTNFFLKINIYSSDFISQTINPNEKIYLTFFMNVFTDSLKIYKIDNLNIPFIQFWKTKEPDNYLKNYFNSSSWDKSDKYIDVRVKDGFKYYVYINDYKFNIDESNVIQIQK